MWLHSGWVPGKNGKGDAGKKLERSDRRLNNAAPKARNQKDRRWRLLCPGRRLETRRACGRWRLLCPRQRLETRRARGRWRLPKP